MAPEFVIVGQGLAGTALAWALLRRGRRVLVLDRERGNRASRVAAGLLTPVTGKRLAPSWRWAELFPAARALYRAVEAETGVDCFAERPALRVHLSADERAGFERRAHLFAHTPCADCGPWCARSFGGWEMPDAARLDVPAFLDASRAAFRARGAYECAEFDPAAALPDATVALCRGYAPGADPWFGAVAFRAAKGELLTVRAPQLDERRVVHGGVWLVPLGAGLFRAGATYSWDPLDAVPTPAGRAELEGRLRALLAVPFEVMGHDAAVRPVIGAGRPVLGTHPRNPRVAFFNGLGSKGALFAPFFAERLAAHLCDGCPIEPEADVRRLLPPG